MGRHKIPKRIGIYTITNIINNKIYVGYSIDLVGRLCDHRTELRKNRHRNDYLQKSWNLHGEENFLFEILEECEEQFLCSQEHYWCMMLNTHNEKYGYNLRPTHPHEKNKLCSPESIEKGASKMRGIPATEKQLECLKKGWDAQKQKSKLGELKMHPNRLLMNYKKIINNDTGQIYNSITEAAKDLDYSFAHLSNMLTGYKTKKINIDYYNN